MAVVAPRDPRAASRRGRGVLGAVGKWLALGAVFVVALGVSIAVHLDLQPVRRTVRLIANRVLTGVFEGRLVIGGIDHLDLHGVTFLDVTTYDPHGGQVIHVHRLQADAELLAIAWSALFGHGDLVIRVPHVHLDDADVTLERDPDDRVSIAAAFELRPRAPGGGRGVRLSLEHIAIDRGRAHGSFAPPAALDGDVTNVSARLWITAEEGLVIDVDPTQVQASTPLPGRIAGSLTFQLQRTGPGDGLVMAATFTGKVGDVGTHASARLHGARLEGAIAIPHATPQEVASLLPEARALRAAGSLAIVAEGELPDLHFDTGVVFDGGGEIDASGTLATRAPLNLDAAVTVRGVDPRVVLDLHAATPVSAAGHLHVADGTVDADARTASFSLSGHLIPGVDARARREDGAWSGTAGVHEVGAPAQVSFSYDPRGALDVEVDAEVASFRAVPRLAIPIDGSGHVHGEGSWRGGNLAARVTARVRDLRAPGAALTRGTVALRLSGQPGSIQILASVQGEGVRTGLSTWERVSAETRGPLLTPRFAITFDGVGRDPVSVQGALDVEAGEITGVRARLGEGEIGVRVARIAVRDGAVRIEGIRLEGAGTLEGRLAFAGGEINGELRGEDVDLDEVARLGGLPEGVAGRARVDLKLASSRSGSRDGHLDVGVDGGEIAGIAGFSGHISTRFDGDRVRTDARFQLQGDSACAGTAAKQEVTGGDLRLPGPLLDMDAWRRVWGRAHLATSGDLGCLRRLPRVQREVAGSAIARVTTSEMGYGLYFDPLGITATAVVLPNGRGTLTTSVTLERAPGALLPSFHDLSVKTEGLEVAGVGFRSLHTDLEITGASLNAATGAAEATLSLRDDGPLASLHLTTTLDLPALLGPPEARWASLRRTPFHGRVSVPRRAVTAFAGLPSFVTERVPLLGGYGDTLAGDVQLDADLGGTVDAPTVDAHVAGWGLGQATIPEPVPAEKGCTGSPPPPEATLGTWGLLVDADAHATYDGREARLDALHLRNGGREVASGSGRVTLPIADLLAGRAQPKGDLRVALDRVPLGEVPYFADVDVGGHLSGTLTLKGLGETPSLHVDLSLPDLAVGHSFVYDRATIVVDVPEPAGGLREARAALALSGGAGGELTVRASAKVSWEKGGILPDQTLPAELTLTAKDFRLAAAAPLLPRRIVGRLGGKLDGTVHLGWADTAPFEADLALRGGEIDLPQLGQRLHDVSAHIAGARDGSVKLTGLSARAGAGRIQGSGSANFERWALQCADVACLSQAEVALTVGSKDRIPLTFGGVPVGEAWGKVRLAAITPDRHLALTVTPDLRVALDPSLGRSVQSLDDAPDLTVCYAPKPPVTARRVSIAVPFKVAVSGKVLDDRVDVVGVTLAGRVRVELGGEHASTSGEITVARGARVELLQKPFEIESGKVTLAKDRQPQIDVTALWEAPEGQLRLGYRGGVAPIDKAGPWCHMGDRSGDACFAALLSGGAEQAAATSGTSAQLHVMAKIAGNVSTSVGTAADGNPQAGLAYDWGRARIGVSTYYGAGASGAPGSAGAAAPQGQRTVVTLDWRFWRSWVLQGHADVGADQETVGAELFWQHRF
jgi:translocation and assembly module TamB